MSTPDLSGATGTDVHEADPATGGQLVDPRTDVHHEHVSDVEPALRGSFSMEKSVVAKVASEAAREVSAAGGTSGGFLGLGTQRDFDARPDTRVTLTGGHAIIEVSCGLPYPVPLRAATEEVRQHVVERVQHLTGVPVERVDIDIDWLSTGDARVRRDLD